MDDEIPEDINVHKQIWGKDAGQVIYGEGEKKNDDEQRCPICNSRINRHHNKNILIRSNGIMI